MKIILTLTVNLHFFNALGPGNPSAAPPEDPSKVEHHGTTEFEEMEGKPQDFNSRYSLVICYLAIEHEPFIVDLPIENGDFP